MAISPVDQREAYTLQSREISRGGHPCEFERHVTDHFLEIMEEAIQIEINMEQIR